MKLLTKLTEQKTAGSWAVGLALCSENNNRVALLLKGVGSGGRGIRGGIHALPGAESNQTGRAQAYGEDNVYSAHGRGVGRNLVEMAFQPQSARIGAYSNRSKRQSRRRSGFAAGGKLQGGTGSLLDV